MNALSWSPTASGDALAAAGWLGANFVLIAAAWKWARRLFRRDSHIELVGHAIVLGWAGIVAVATTLGGTGRLGGSALLAGVATLALVAFGISRLRLAAPPGPVPLDAAGKPWLALWVVLLGFSVGHVITEGVGQFPTDWDSLAYHIPLVDHWLQVHSLWSTGCARWANPGNNELVTLWVVAPFSGDFLVSLTNLPAAVLLACGGVSLAGQLGLPRPLAHLAGLALVCNFVVLKQLVDAENDVAVAGCFFAALAYIFRHIKEPKPAPLVLGAVSLGLLAGVKYYALGYAGLALAVWAVLAAVAHGRGTAIQVLATGVAGLVAFGGFWYARNWLLTDSPLYPREFFKHPDLLQQIYPDIAKTSFFGNRSPELLGLYVQAIWQRTGPYQCAGFLLAPFSLSWLLGSAGRYVLRGGEAAQAGTRAAVAALLVGTGLLLGMTPFAVEDRPGTLNQMHWYYCPVRYGLCFLGTVTMAALLMLHDVVCGWRKAGVGAAGESRRWPTAVRFLACLVFAAGILFQVVWADRRLRFQWVNDFLVAGDVVSGWLVLVLIKAIWPRLRLAVLAIITLPVWVWAFANVSHRWHQEFMPFYERMAAFEGLSNIERIKTGPQTILVLQPRCYPFFGPRRQYRVRQPVYVPSPGWIMEFIETEGVAFVAADLGMWPGSMGHRRFLGFDKCLARHPDRFRALEEDRDTLYEVLPPTAEQARMAATDQELPHSRAAR